MPRRLEVGHGKGFRRRLLLRWPRRLVPVHMLSLGPRSLFPLLQAVLERVVQRYQSRYRLRRIGRVRDGRWRRFRGAQHRYRGQRFPRTRRRRAGRRCCRRRRRGGRPRRSARGRRRRGGHRGRQHHRSRDRRHFLVEIVRRAGTVFFVRVTLHRFLFQWLFGCDPAKTVIYTSLRSVHTRVIIIIIYYVQSRYTKIKRVHEHFLQYKEPKIMLLKRACS